MRWAQGRSEVQQLIDEGFVERIVASREAADRMLVTARQHVESAETLADSDPDAAYAVMYDGSRKALAAVLENQGLRATTRGGHLAVYDVVRAQLHPPQGPVLRPFDRMRRRRHQTEYPSSEHPQVTADEVREELPKVEAIIETAAAILDHMDSF